MDMAICYASQMRFGAVFLAGVVAVAGARQDKPAQTFRTGIDLLQLDVSVLDKDRHPVQGLSADDFTVLVDGLPRPVVALRAVDLPKPVPSSAPWIRDVAPDVATNTHPGGRVVVIMIDDGSFFNLPDADVWTVQKTRALARAALNELGPDDLAAVVYTENNHAAQSFTTDRRRLLTAIDTSVIFPGATASTRGDDSSMPAITGSQRALMADSQGVIRGSCSCGVCSIEALGRVAESLRSLPQQRKIVIYISAGVSVDISMGPFVPLPSAFSSSLEACERQKHEAMLDAFRQAQLSNVTIQAMDPKGLKSGGTRVEFLRTMAEATGGRAVVNRNDVEEQVPAVIAESSSYYLLAVESPVTKDDGRLHPIQVRVNRPGLEVRTRNGYYAPTEKERKAMTAGPSRDLDASIAAAVPKAGFPMEVVVAPFAAANRKAELAIVLAVTQPNDAPARSAARTERVEVLASAFNPETGRAVGSGRQTLNIVWNPTAASGGQYEVMQRLPLSPGRYELRLGAKIGNHRTASVYTHVDVPDFAREPLSLSGLVLSAIPSPKAAKDTFKDLMPVTPTARRTFRRSDRVTALLRVYQGGTHPVVPVTITTRLVDGMNAQVGGGVRPVDVASFGTARSFDDQFDLPVQLPPGEYLLTVDVAAGGKTAQRTLRFRVL
jgi:VWFA-related protein